MSDAQPADLVRTALKLGGEVRVELDLHVKVADGEQVQVLGAARLYTASGAPEIATASSGRGPRIGGGVRRAPRPDPVLMDRRLAAGQFLLPGVGVTVLGVASPRWSDGPSRRSACWALRRSSA